MRYLLSTILLVVPAIGQAQVTCVPWEDGDKNLREKYGEQVVIEGYINDNSIMNLYHNSTTDTWTVVIIHSNGVACMVGAGSDLNFLKPLNGEQL